MIRKEESDLLIINDIPNLNADAKEVTKVSDLSLQYWKTKY